MSSRAADFVRLFATERGRLLGRLSRRVGCPATAADLVQDIFLRLWERRSEAAGNPAAYLNRSARNAAIDHLRAERVRAAHVTGLTPEQHGAQAAPSPQQLFEARDRLDRVDEAIRRLPERTRDIFLLHRIHGRGYGEIAGVFGISVSGVEKHMAKALEACRRSIAGEDETS
ncbi:RNA polymerase sigma factor [Roseococcus pinisoli]|uniref:Sigma-70 family RNA polymerase sigma factor n=1 Tax=Roseococcus pinisoli TaxID=2835040 RepID=A0ABS5Q9C8_9PROT|nr:sigma-70 family RNA polymerase sigma factor [Roseococcus pinisoli]MBS7810077.1 sigma-70 family RNA polymerase sigma factor [Roseococcus pinisoli]